MNKLDLNGKTFELTNDYVYEGVRKDSGQCPLALALWDFLTYDMNTGEIDTDELCINVDFKIVTVEYSTMDEDSAYYTCYLALDDAITDFICDFDNELIAYKQFMGRTVHVELLEDQSYKLSFEPRQF